jgi:hypothetical protein
MKPSEDGRWNKHSRRWNAVAFSLDLADLKMMAGDQGRLVRFLDQLWDCGYAIEQREGIAPFAEGKDGVVAVNKADVKMSIQ